MNNSEDYVFANFRKKLEERLGTKANITFTNNKVSLINVYHKSNVLNVRIHKMFINADEAVFQAITDFIKNRTEPSKIIRDFVKHYQSTYKSSSKQHIVKPIGKYHNLEDIFNNLNKLYFNNRVEAKITWGKSYKKTPVKKRVLGSYDIKNNIIRINPILDSEKVPPFYIDFVVYHEMLHAFLKNKNGRWHCSEFKLLEQNYDFYEEAVKWEKNIKL